MDDMTDILQVRSSPSPPAVEAKHIPTGSKKKKSQKGISREVFALMSSDAQAAAAALSENEVGTVTIGRKFTIDPSFRSRSWQWEGYHNSARRDGVRLKHWMRKPMVVDDYPFTRFNKPVYVVSYTEAQYEELLTDANWTKTETDTLLALCRRFDCRWPVVLDRWPEGPGYPPKSLVDLRERYFFVAKTLVSKYTEEQLTVSESIDHRLAKLTADARNALKAFTFDGEEERDKRLFLELQFKRNKTADVEVASLQGELQKLDVELKKLRADRKRLEEKQKVEDKKKRKKAVEVIAAAQTAAGLTNGPSSTGTGSRKSTSELGTSKSTPPPKKTKIEIPDVTLSELPAVVVSITASHSQLGDIFKRSQMCRPINCDDTVPQTNGIKLQPPLGVQQAKSLALLLAKREGEGQPIPTEGIAKALVPYYEDAVRLIVYEHAVKKKKNELRSAKLRLKKSKPAGASPAGAKPAEGVKSLEKKPAANKPISSSGKMATGNPVPIPALPPMLDLVPQAIEPSPPSAGPIVEVAGTPISSSMDEVKADTPHSDTIADAAGVVQNTLVVDESGRSDRGSEEHSYKPLPVPNGGLETGTRNGGVIDTTEQSEVASGMSEQ